MRFSKTLQQFAEEPESIYDMTRAQVFEIGRFVESKRPKKQMRSPSEYQQFLKDEIPRVRETNPYMDPKEVFRIAVQNWKTSDARSDAYPCADDMKQGMQNKLCPVTIDGKIQWVSADQYQRQSPVRVSPRSSAFSSSPKRFSAPHSSHSSPRSTPRRTSSPSPLPSLPTFTCPPVKYPNHKVACYSGPNRNYCVETNDRCNTPYDPIHETGFRRRPDNLRK